MILVTGATGNVGRHLVEQLLSEGHRVRALTRHPQSARLPAEVETVGGDLDYAETLGAVFTGVTAAHLINFGKDYEVLQNGQDIVDLAVRDGVRLVTMLGGWDEGTLEPAVQASGLEWTHLMPVEFMANTLDWVEPLNAGDVIEEPFADRRSAAVHEADIAAVAAAVLTAGGHGGKSYPISGPEVLTPVGKVETLAAATGRDLRLAELTETEARRKWAEQGTPDDLIDFMIEAWGNTPEVGYTVNSTVQQVTGRSARTFAQWCTEHADRFKI